MKSMKRKIDLFRGFPSSLWAALIPSLWIISYTFIDYWIFTTTGGRSNPVIFYTILIIIIALTLREAGWERLVDSLGFNVDKWWKALVAALTGFGVGFGLYMILGKALQRAAIFPLPALTTMVFGVKLDVLSTIIIHTFVGLGEEILCLYLFATWSNFFYSIGISRDISLITGAILGRVEWGLSHLVSYTMMGAYEIGSYIFAILIGLIFTGLGLFFMIFKKGEPLYFGEYVVIGAWIAHTTWNVLVDLHFMVYGTPLQLIF